MDRLHLPADADCPSTAVPSAVVGDAVWTATGHERPVFLDEHGRRRRWVALGGALTGSAATVWLGALVAGAIGFSTLPSMQPHSSLIASRTPSRPVALAARHHRHTVARKRSPSGLGGAAELAVSRGLTAP